MMKSLLNEVEKEVRIRGINDSLAAEVVRKIPALKNRRVVGGYASVIMVDREGHKITKEALIESTARFMSELYYRPINVFHCLKGDTPIFVCIRGNRYVPISSLKVGDKVYTHAGNLQKIKEVIVHENNGPALKICLSNKETITITDEHPILTRDRGWVEAKNLKIGDVLLHCVPKSCEKGSNRIKELCVGKTMTQLYGAKKAKEIKESCSKANKGNKYRVGKTLSVESRLKLSTNRKGKGIGKREGYTLTDKHNSQQRLGKTWFEVYGHDKPYYGGNAGEKNVNWRGGSSLEKYSREFRLIRKSILDRDNYTCQLCGDTADLHTHHIDYNKDNNYHLNLITLCRTCYAKTGHNRDYWLNLFVGKTSIAVANGISITNIESIWYTGKVYNLEVENDHSYAGKGIIYHNSDVTVGRILPKWTNPKTGEMITSHVDDIGWYIVAEIRDDIEIADKVWEEVERGNIRSFSIAGSSHSKTEDYENGRAITLITKLSIYEITLCEQPVNPMSKFDFFYSPNEAWI